MKLLQRSVGENRAMEGENWRKAVVGARDSRLGFSRRADEWAGRGKLSVESKTSKIHSDL